MAIRNLTLRDLIAYRPLVYAWIWEMICLAAAVAVLFTAGGSPLVLILALAGMVPFALAVLRLSWLRKQGWTPDKGRGIVE